MHKIQKLIFPPSKLIKNNNIPKIANLGKNKFNNTLNNFKNVKSKIIFRVLPLMINQVVNNLQINICFRNPKLSFLHTNSKKINQNNYKNSHIIIQIENLNLKYI